MRNFSLHFKVHSLQCYQCYSATSMEDCSSQQVMTQCPNLQGAACVTVEVRHEKDGALDQFFAKGRPLIVSYLERERTLVLCLSSLPLIKTHCFLPALY